MGLLHARSGRASHMRMHEWARAALILGSPVPTGPRLGILVALT
jgi:hypothetical protein